jgi:osmotically-inducible protein OsmY
MADRKERDRNRGNDRNNDYNPRQAEQFEDRAFSEEGGYGQSGREGSQGGEGYYEETTIMPRRDRTSGGGTGSSSNSQREQGSHDDYGDDDYRSRSGGYQRSPTNYGGASYGRQDRDYGRFTRDDQGRRDPERGGRRSHGSFGTGYRDYASGGRGQDEYGTSRDRSRGYWNPDEDRDDRGFFERAGDEIASWFGDEDAERRREMDNRGRGPGNYTRSDERILEDVCDQLTEDWRVDASNIQVTVKEGEVTLDGTVDSRQAKRRAEDCVHDLSGVKHVQNNLRIQDRPSDLRTRDSKSSES